MKKLIGKTIDELTAEYLAHIDTLTDEQLFNLACTHAIWLGGDPGSFFIDDLPLNYEDDTAMQQVFHGPMHLIDTAANTEGAGDWPVREFDDAWKNGTLTDNDKKEIAGEAKRMLINQAGCAFALAVDDWETTREQPEEYHACL